MKATYVVPGVSTLPSTVHICDATIEHSTNSVTVNYALQAIAKRFNHRNISDNDTDVTPLGNVKRCFMREDTTILGKDFARAIGSLCTKELFDAEDEHIKSTSEYINFLSSSLLKALTAELEEFFSTGNWEAEVYSYKRNISPSEVTSCSVTVPNSMDEQFSFVLETSNHESDYGYYLAHFLKGKPYRKLSIHETSMLAIALSDKFPHFFTYTWGLYNHGENKTTFLGKDKYLIVFELGLTPEVIKKPKSSNKIEPPPVIDIY